MPRCVRCKEWFIGDGELCLYCKMRLEVEEHVRAVKADLRRGRA